PLALDGDPKRELAGPALHAPALADLQHERVQKEHRVDVVQEALLPLADVVHDGVGDAADQVTTDVDAVQLGKVPLDVPRGQAPPVQGADLVVEAPNPPPA